MPLADILAAITAETDAAVAEIDADGEARAQAVVARARARAAALEQERADHRRAETRRAAERIVNGARLETDRLLRDSRAALYAEAHRLVVRQLAAQRHAAGYPAVFERLLSEALARLPDAHLVRVVSDDVVLAQRLLDGNGMRVEGSLAGWGGVVAVGVGRLVDNTLGGRLRRADPELRRLAGDVLPELRAAAPG